MTGKVPQVHRAVVVSAVVDVPHALAVKYVAELGDPDQLTRHQKQREKHATKSLINRRKNIVRKRRPLILAGSTSEPALGCYVFPERLTDGGIP